MLRNQRWLYQPSFAEQAVLCTFLMVLLLTPVTAFAQGKDLALDRSPAQGRDGGPGEMGASTLRDGVVVDTARGVAYVMAPGGSVDAVDLSRGQVIWSSAEAGRPLAVSGNRLLAQAQSRETGGLEIVSLDTERGVRMGANARIALPEGVNASIDDSLGRSFDVSARIADGGAVVSWRESRNDQALQGFVTADQVEGTGATPSKSSLIRHEGAARIEFSSGRVTALAAGEPSAGFEAGVSRLATTRELQGVSGRQYVSGDGRHVLASERLGSSGYPPQFRWTLHARDTGQSRGYVDNRTAAAPFVVFGDRILYETRPYAESHGGELIGEPLSIRVADLGSGAELWSMEIRDTEYRGPFPP